MQQKEIQFNFSARYFTLGSITRQTKAIWFVLHGYGQLGEYFLKKFAALANRDIYLVAPEGLSRFYVEEVTKRAQGGSNRVGASWMTRENRLMDIDNYLSCLHTIYTAEIPGDFDIPVTLLGFSQGAATASRWAIDSRDSFQRLILWAGIFPDDMNFERAHEALASKKIQLIYGTQDPFLTDERLMQMEKLRQKLNVPAEVITFEGKHEIDEATLLKIA
jgi:predicted esterase